MLRLLFVMLVVLAACGDDDGAPDAGDAAQETGFCEDACSGSTEFCDELTGSCAECLFDDDCTQGQRCTDTECVEVLVCTDSLDCVIADSQVCDPTVGECVDCVSAFDCADNHDCSASRCEPFTPCMTSLDCDTDQVCDDTPGRCVQCVTSTDCEDEQICASQECHAACDSDKDCTPMGLLCDKAGGYCVQCLNNERCADALHCSLGACVRDVCRAGATACQESRVMRCTEAGDGFVNDSTCPEGQVCIEDGGNASCRELASSLDAGPVDAGGDACSPACTGTDVCVVSKCIATEPPSANLLAWWDFEPGADASTLYDRSGRGHHGTNNAGAMYVAEAIRGQAIRFTGGGISVPHHADFLLDPQVDQFTIIFWLNGDPDGYDNGFGIPFQKWDYLTNTPIPWSFRYDPGGLLSNPEPLLVLVYPGSGGINTFFTGVVPSTWYQIGFVADFGTLLLYVDAELVMQVDISLPGSLSNTANIGIGVTRYKGMLDEMTVFRGAFSAEEIQRERDRVMLAP